jgi:predicted AAA+ superfamily ATPase
LYHYDWTLVEDEACRFENLVAAALLKYCHFLQDAEGRETELRFFRDVDLREVDFVLMENGRPWQFIECKLRQREAGKGLRYLKKRFPQCQATQISLHGSDDYTNRDGIRVCPADRILSSLV